VARRVGNDTSGLRDMLIAYWQRQHKRWGLPDGGGISAEMVQDLRPHVPVQVSGSVLLFVCSANGLPAKDYSYGGRYRDSVFVFDEDDRLIEVDDCG
jgi:hypothetical protein